MHRNVAWKHAFARGMAALLATIVVVQVRPAEARPADMFSIPAPAIGADPPKATAIQDGDSSVSTQTGALQYSYPIQVPPGRNGMAPQLALAYSSQAPTYGGIAAGWSLSVPLISEDFSQGRLRTRSSMEEQYQLDHGIDPKADDRFVSSLAGGRPLVSVTEPSIPVDGNVYKRYRAQNDTSFTRYERMKPSAPFRWRTLTTDGVTMEFGEGALMTNCDPPTDQYAPLTRTRDRFGNEVRYEYDSWLPGECRLVRVVWGQNAGGLSDFARVNLEWSRGPACNGVIPNTQTDYRSGRLQVTGASALVRLTAIAYPPGNSSAPTHTRQITLAYESEKDDCGLSHAPIRSLRSIQESAWGTNAPRVDLPPITFTYNSPAVALTTPGGELLPWSPTMRSLGWGYRRIDGRWPTVEAMFFDVDGDGLQDLVENAPVTSGGAVASCRARWRRNKGEDASGLLRFETAAEAEALDALGLEHRFISMPRLKWHNIGNNTTQDGAPTADASALNREGCSLNAQITTFVNSGESSYCHIPVAGVQPTCQAGSVPNNADTYCYPGGTECPGAAPDTQFRTYLAYRWLDADADGLVDLVAAIHGDINVYDPEWGSLVGHLNGEPAMPGIPGAGQWPGCPGPEVDRCQNLDDCLQREGARTCGPGGCVVDWEIVNACADEAPVTGCANVMAKLGGVVGEPNPEAGGGPSSGHARGYTRCEGLYPWLIYKNSGNGSFATTPTIKYQPIPLESSNGDSSFGGPSIASTHHAFEDFDGDGWNDVIMREVDDSEAVNSTSYAWQVWLGDGTGGVEGTSHLFPTRSSDLPCNLATGTCIEAGNNAISAIGGTWGAEVRNQAGMIDINGDGAQDHWLALSSTGPANVSINLGDQHEPYGDVVLPSSPAVRPASEVWGQVVDINGQPTTVGPGQDIQFGYTKSNSRVADVDGDGRQDVIRWPYNGATVPKVHFNVGGQFAYGGVDYPGNAVGAQRETKADDPHADTETRTWRLNADLMDLDGDGLPESVYFVDGTYHRVKPASAQPPRLLSRVENGRGLTTDITYAQMHSDEVVQAPTEFWPDTGRPKVSPRAQWVVKSMTTTDAWMASPAGATTTYLYKHPRYGADDEGHYSFRGFGEVVTTSPDATGAANGKRTIQRYGYDVDWSGRLTETLVLPATWESATDVRSISKTTWEAQTLFAGAITTYHPSVSRQYTCANGQNEAACLAGAPGYTQTTTTWKPLPIDVPDEEELLIGETYSTLQAGTSPADGDRHTATEYQIDTGALLYKVHPTVTTRSHREGGSLSMYAKSKSTWDPVYGTQLTQETWIDGDDNNRLIARSVYDNTTGNVVQRWKPKQNAASSTKTVLAYDLKQLFVITETNELGQQLGYSWDYGTGTRLQTFGFNFAMCFFTTACPPGSLYREHERIVVDGLGRTLERWATFGGFSYTERKLEMNTYDDTSSAWSPTSVTHEAATDMEGATVLYGKDKTELDGHGRPFKRTVYVFGSAATDAITLYDYALDGTLVGVSVPDPSQNSGALVTYTYGYDSLGRPTSIRRPDAANAALRSGVDMSYDGLTTTTREEVGAAGGQEAVTRATKDAFGRLVTIDEQTAASPQTWATTSYEYGPDDSVREIVSLGPDAVTTTLVHDFAGRRTRIERHGRTWKYGYDANGNLESVITPCAGLTCEATHMTSIVYDDLDRPTTKLPAPRGLDPQEIDRFGLASEEYVWENAVNVVANGRGRLRYWRAKNASGAIVVQSDRQYDGRGNVTQDSATLTAAGYNVTRGFGRSFNANNAPKETYYYDYYNSPNGGQGNTVTTQSYDRRGLPSSMSVHRQRTGMHRRTIAVQTRNVAGLVIERKTPASSFWPSWPSVESDWTYDTLGRVMSQIVQKTSSGSTEQVVREDLTYLGNDDPATLTRRLGSLSPKTFAFSYDPRHQIVGVAETALPNAFTASYQYQDAGRFAAATVAATPLSGQDVVPRDVLYQYTDADPERLTKLVQASDGVTPFRSYAYDEAGNQTIQCEGTLTGTTCSGPSIHFLYDGKDQLRRATKRNAQGVTLSSEDYWYDGDNKRVSAVQRDSAGASTGMTFWIQDTEAYYSNTGSLLRTVAHLGMGTPVGRVDHRGPGTGASLELLFHGLGNNTLAAVNGETGAINASFSYAPFGEVLEATDGGGAQTGIAAHQRRFNDKYQDAISGLTYYGFRYYDKLTMSWTQSDPLYRFVPDAAWAQPRKAGLYVANLNNPLRYLDPDGRQSVTWREVAGALGVAAAAPEVLPLVAAAAVGAGLGYVASKLANVPGVETGDVYCDGCYPQEASPYSLLFGDSPRVVGNPKWVSNMMNEAKAKAADEKGATGGNVQANNAQGKAFEDKVNSELESDGYETSREVTVKTSSGTKTRLDIVGKKDGKVSCVECKSSDDAPLTKNQKKAFPEIEQSGATVVGKGKPGMPGGTTIPPTKVEVKRPQ